MRQHPPVNDDPIQENAPPPGVTYKTVTSRMVEDLGKRVADGQPLKAEDLKGWGPQATRTLQRWLGAEVSNDSALAVNLLNRVNARTLSPEKLPDEAENGIRGAKVRQDLLSGFHPGMSPQERSDLSIKIQTDQREFMQSYAKVVNDRLAAVGSPPALSGVAGNVFNQGVNVAIKDKSNGNYSYPEVSQQQVADTAQNLLMGKRDDVRKTISSWGANALDRLATVYEQNWEKDKDNARRAVSMIGQPEYAAMAKNIQNPELKAKVEEASKKFAAGASRDEVTNDVRMWLGGKDAAAGHDVYAAVKESVQKREQEFLNAKNAGQSAPVAPASATATYSPLKVSPPAAPAGSDIANTAQVFAHEPYSKWPALNGWTVENIAKLQIATNDQIRKDRDSALGIAIDAVDDRKRINEIQNPVMKAIVERDINVGQPYEVIAKHIQDAAKSQTAAVNDRIQNTTPGPSSAPQRSSGPGGPGGA